MNGSEPLETDRTVADRLAAALLRYDVRQIFGQSLPSEILLAAERVGIRQIGYRTENAGGAMADGYARISGRLGVVTAQNGPAAALLVAPLAESLKASIPVLALVQDVPRAARNRNAFQEFDHFGLLGSCTKWITRLESPERLDEELDLAVVSATSGRPGPVVLLLPKDVMSVPSGVRSTRSAALGGFPLDRPRPAWDQVNRVARLLAGARSPIIVAGGGVHTSGACEALAAMQEQAGIPVATTTMGKGAVDETHELSIGVVGSFMGRRSPAWGMQDFIRQADAILLIGTRTNENGTDVWRLFAEDASFAHLDIASDEISRNYQSIRLVGDARSGLEDLVAVIQTLDIDPGRRAAAAYALAQTRERAAGAIAEVTESAATPIRPERVMAELDAQIDGDAIIVADASYSTMWAAAYLRARRPGQRFLSPRGLAGLGWGLPMALGAQVASAGSRVVCIVGDGAFAHSWAELETAVRADLPITVILLNNNTLGYQRHAELHALGAHTTAVNFSNVDHAAIARACGAESEVVDDPVKIRATLERALASRKPTLVEIFVDQDAYPPIAAWEGSAGLAAAGIADPNSTAVHR